MRKFSANLSMLFNELAFLDRFAAASNAGFRGVEYISPYDHDPAKIADLLQQNGLEQVLFNLPVGDWAAGERGIAVLPERKHEFRDGVARAVRYAKALRCPQVNCLAGIVPAHVDVAILRQTLIENLRYASGELAANNIRLLIEPINTRDMPGFFLNTSTDALGVIAEVGSAVGGVKAGDKVLISSGLACGHCTQCLSGLDNLCREYRVIGVRDYTPHDSLRRIHWNASARHQTLQVKVFEPTTTLNVALFLAVDSFKTEHGEVPNEEDFELGISTAASVANHLIERRCAVGLFVNSYLADSGQSVEILPGSSTGQLVEMLEALAKVTHKASGPFEEFLQAERMGFPWGTAFVFILYTPSPSLTEMLISLKESGHRLMVLQVGKPAESKIESNIAWHNIRQPGDFMRIGGESR